MSNSLKKAKERERQRALEQGFFDGRFSEKKESIKKNKKLKHKPKIEEE